MEKDFKELLVKEYQDDEVFKNDLMDLINYVCEEYLNIDKPKLILTSDKEVSTHYDLKSDTIYLNKKFINNRELILEAIFHELEHKYQILYAGSFDTPKAKRWKKELMRYQKDNEELNLLQEIELDAYAFSEVLMMELFGIKKAHPKKEIQKLIDTYLLEGYILSDN